MGKRTSSSGDVTRAIKTYSATANGDYGPVEVLGVVNLSLGGALPLGCVAKVLYSYDGGVTYYPAPADAVGTQIGWTDASAAPACVLDEEEQGMLYIVRLSGTWTGTVPIRFSA